MHAELSGPTEETTAVVIAGPFRWHLLCRGDGLVNAFLCGLRGRESRRLSVGAEGVSVASSTLNATVVVVKRG